MTESILLKLKHVKLNRMDRQFCAIQRKRLSLVDASAHGHAASEIQAFEEM